MFAGVTMVPLIVARASGFTPVEAANIVTMAILVSGIATLIQVVRVGPVGSGHLCVMGSSGLFIQPCILAGKQGGPALIFDMSLALAVGVGVQMMPELWNAAPPLLRPLRQTSTCSGALTAILLELFLPREPAQPKAAKPPAS